RTATRRPRPRYRDCTEAISLAPKYAVAYRDRGCCPTQWFYRFALRAALYRASSFVLRPTPADRPGPVSGPDRSRLAGQLRPHQIAAGAIRHRHYARDPLEATDACPGTHP